MNKAYVKREFVENLSPQAFAALTGILLNARKQSLADDWVCTSPVIIAAVLTGKEPTESDLTAMNKGFRDLAGCGLIEKYLHNQYIVHYSDIEREDESFVCLEEQEIRIILDSPSGVNRFSLLQYFAFLKSTINYATKISSLSVVFYQTKTGKSILTINKYHRTLEKLGVLKVFRFKPGRMSDGSLSYANNVYCLPKDTVTAIQTIREKGMLKRLKPDKEKKGKPL